ncbi:MAG TPA: phospholipase D-like domain-containing protein [Chitinophagaceae bacterium]|nr:phospholipase D-like domain-containing protein [Chitinophagaceae bacterium]
MPKKYSRNTVQLIHSGLEFFDTLCRMIDSAKQSVHLHTYIFNDDHTGTLVADSLIAAAKRKVEVFLLVDGYASQHLPVDFIRNLQEAGVHFRFFEPLFQSRYLYFGRRLHHKVVVIDAACALIGGLNIADRYNTLPGQPAWFDLALYIEGAAATELYHICQQLWLKKGRFRKKTGPSYSVPDDPGVHEGVAARIRINDWVKRQQEVTATYMELFRSASHRITIICSYFLPGLVFRTQLKRAAKRGVKIKVVLASRSDVPVSKYAERYLYRWMLRHAIEIYEYQPTVLHAKMAIADDEMLTIGSYNVNNISRHASIELNIEVKDKEFASEVLQEIDRIIQRDCKPINTMTYTTRLFSFKQFLQWIAFQWVRIMMTVSTFYFRQKE